MTLATTNYCQVFIREESIRVSLMLKSNDKSFRSMHSSSSNQTLLPWEICVRWVQSRACVGRLQARVLPIDFSTFHFVKGLA